MRLDTKFGRWLFIGSGIMVILGIIMIITGSKSGLFPLVIGSYIFFQILAKPG